MKKFLLNLLGFSILGLIVCPLYDLFCCNFIKHTEFVYRFDIHALFPFIIILVVITFVALCSINEISYKKETL